MAVTAGVLMMAGLAGDDKLTLYYRGALLLWLLLLTVRCWAMARRSAFGSIFSAIALAGGCTMAIASIIVWYTAEQSREVIVFILQALAVGVLLVIVWPALVTLFPKLKK
jgi:hypothetical protein